VNGWQDAHERLSGRNEDKKKKLEELEAQLA